MTETVALPTLLAELRERFGPKDPGPCRVCGSKMECGAVDRFNSEWHCGSPEANACGKPGGIWGEEAEKASQHWWASTVKLRHGDDRIVRLCEFVERIADRHPQAVAEFASLLQEPEEADA